MSEAICVEVTHSDIFDGVPNAECDCAVALACRRAFRVERVDVTSRRALVYHGDEFQEFVLPTEAIVWMEQFDNREPVEPFEFELSQ